MRGVRFEEFGGPEVLRHVELPLPQPGPGQVAIGVEYVGVNFADLQARTIGYRVPGLPFVPGLELSGRVRSLGEGVQGLAVGQPVAAITDGGADGPEVAVVDAAATFPVPEGIDLRTAATLPTVLPTAFALIHTIGRVQPGETVLYKVRPAEWEPWPGRLPS